MHQDPVEINYDILAEDGLMNGLKYGFPLCCVFWFTSHWEEVMKEHYSDEIEYYSPESGQIIPIIKTLRIFTKDDPEYDYPEYVQCPECLANHYNL